MDSTKSSINQHPARAARAYAKKGIPVFRLRPGTKEPLHGSRGFYDATTDEDRVGGWWSSMPDANIGIPTGEASGLLVLDVDPDAGGTAALEELVAVHGELPATTTAKTGRGGVHYYFRYPAGKKVGNSVGLLGKGLDVRGAGGYIVAPGSATTGAYEWTERLPLAEPPEWLLEALRTNPRASTTRTRSEGDHAPTPIAAAGETITEGGRNANLTRIAGGLHDGTRSLERLTTDLLGINARRCVPPLPEAEVGKIAASIHRRAPAKPTKTVEPEVLEILDRVEEAHLWGREWKGPGWKTPRSVVAVLVQEARRHGWKVEDGVEVSISVRALALAACVSKHSLTRRNGALDKLRGGGLIRSTPSSGKKAGGFVLVAPRGVATLTHSSTEAPLPSSGSTLPHPPTGPRLRYSKPVYASVDGVRQYSHHIERLGKTAEQIVDVLEKKRGWVSVSELRDTLGLKANRDLRRRALHRLTEASVVEWSGDNVRLRLDWLAAVNRRREEDEENADHNRDRERYAEQSRNHRDRLETRKLWRVGESPEEIATTIGRGIEDVRRFLGIERSVELEPFEADGFIEDLERVEEDPVSPSPPPGLCSGKEEPRVEYGALEVVEDPVDRRRRAVEAVMVRLFQDRPEYRGRRVGQIACCLPFYLPADFPRDLVPGGAPKDAEVAAILEENGMEVAV